jgi:hypothetical protein
MHQVVMIDKTIVKVVNTMEWLHVTTGHMKKITKTVKMPLRVMTNVSSNNDSSSLSYHSSNNNHTATSVQAVVEDDGELVLPYCDTPEGKNAPSCHDRYDFYESGPKSGLYPCNDVY